MKNTMMLRMLLAASSLVPAAALAQTPQGGASEPEGIADIVVTARRMEESLQTTPIAVTAISTEGLERAQVRTMEDVQRLAPNLSVSSGVPSASGFAFLSIRGQANLEALTTNDPAIGTYIDGIYIGRPAQGLFNLVDVARVEVLRGPQGTLFGRNTIGGAINITTNQPTNKFEGWVEGQIGNYDDRRLTGVLNVPLVNESVGVRLVYRHIEHDGYGYNVPTKSDLFDARSDDTFRGTVRIAPVDAIWSLTVVGDYNKTRDSGILTNLSGWNKQAPALAGVDLDPYVVSKDRNFYRSFGTIGDFGDGYTFGNKLKTYGAAATLDVDLGAVNFKSITGARKLASKGYQDLDSTPLDLLAVYAAYNVKQFSQEIQVSGAFGGLNWITGLYYFKETSHDFSVNEVFGFFGLPPSFNDANIANTSRAAFAQLYYEVSDRLRLTGGLRYTIDTRKVVLHNLDAFGVAASCNVVRDEPGGVCNQTLDRDFKYPAWTAGADYRINPSLFVYAKTSGASMSGGWNARQGSPVSFDPEQAKDVEIGVKADWLDRRLRTNVALFHTWQSNVQRSVGTVVGTTTTQYTLNAGDAHVNGAEFEVTAAPWRGLEVSGSLGLIRAAYDKGTFKSNQAVGGVVYSVDRSGETLPQVPRTTYNVSATQRVPISVGELEIHADYAYISKQTYYVDTPADAQPQSVKDQYAEANRQAQAAGYGLLNARIGLRLNSPDLEFNLFARNITDKKYVTRTYANLYKDLGYVQHFPGQPRTYGLSVRVGFGAQ